jgi:hypothetical protein
VLSRSVTQTNHADKAKKSSLPLSYHKTIEGRNIFTPQTEEKPPRRAGVRAFTSRRRFLMQALTADERAVLELMLADPGAFTCSCDVARTLEISTARASHALEHLVNSRLVRESWTIRHGSIATVYMPSWLPTDLGRQALAEPTP